MGLNLRLCFYLCEPLTENLIPICLVALENDLLHKFRNHPSGPELCFEVLNVTTKHFREIGIGQTVFLLDGFQLFFNLLFRRSGIPGSLCLLKKDFLIDKFVDEIDFQAVQLFSACFP